MNIPHGVLTQVLNEIDRAEIKHPFWPHDDRIWQAAIVVEEAGEVMKAALEEREAQSTLKPLTATTAVDHTANIVHELAQTAAMAIRMMCSLRGQDVKEARDQEACIDPRLGRSR